MLALRDVNGSERLPVFSRELVVNDWLPTRTRQRATRLARSACTLLIKLIPLRYPKTALPYLIYRIGRFDHEFFIILLHRIIYEAAAHRRIAAVRLQFAALY